MNWPLFASVFSVIFIAELPDKTALSTLLMATKGRPTAVFLGVAMAFLVQCLVAVAFGRLIALLPQTWVHLASGLIFLFFAYQAWFAHEEDEEKGEACDLPKPAFWPSAGKAFVVIFIAEWGDLTQIATASLAARYEESLVTVFLAATLALWSVTGIAVVVGRKVGHLVHVGLLHKVSAVLFAGIGLYFLATWLF